MAANENTRPQFSLAALFGAVIACGVIFGLLANMETSYRVTIRCSSLPADDQKLSKWFRDQDGVQNVLISRDEKTINVEFTKRHGSFELLAPPLSDLGYAGLQGMKSTISKPSIIGMALNFVLKVPMLIWVVGVALVTALLARKIMRARPPATQDDF